MTEIEIVALHEAAHFEAASEVGIHSCPVIFDEPQPQANGRPIAGECRFDRIARPSTFQAAVVAWAGVIMEGLLGITHTLPEMPFPLSRRTMKDWFRAAMANFERLSLGDQALIAKAKSPWRAFKSAFRIVSKNKRRIARLARLMVQQKTKGQTNMQQTTSVPRMAPPPQTEAERLAHCRSWVEGRLAAPDLAPGERAELERYLAAYKAGIWPGQQPAAGQTS